MAERNRYGKEIKQLLIKTKGDDEKAKAVMKWVSQQGYADWTINTCIKKFNDFKTFCPKCQGKLYKKI